MQNVEICQLFVQTTGQMQIRNKVFFADFKTFLTVQS